MNQQGCRYISGAEQRTLEESDETESSTSSTAETSASSVSSASSSDGQGGSTQECGMDQDTTSGWPDSWTAFCTNGQINISCADSNAIGQDGALRFPLPSYAIEDSGILDHRTKLVWTSEIVAEGVTLSEAEETCSDLGGRLPTRVELISLFDYGADTLTFCSGFFTSGTISACHWSSVNGGDDTSWCVDATNGSASTVSNNATNGVRCVLSGEYSPTYTLADDENGEPTIKAESTGLEWKTTPEDESYSWFDAMAACDNLVGDPAWRLPTIKELQSILEENKTPMLADLFDASNLSSNAFWSATPYVKNPEKAWSMDIGTGLSPPTSTSDQIQAWCVRYNP